MTAYLLTSAILIGTLGVIWERKNWLNVIVKLGLLGVSGWGFFSYLSEMGYIIKG